MFTLMAWNALLFHITIDCTSIDVRCLFVSFTATQLPVILCYVKAKLHYTRQLASWSQTSSWAGRRAACAYRSVSQAKFHYAIQLESWSVTSSRQFYYAVQLASWSATSSRAGQPNGIWPLVRKRRFWQIIKITLIIKILTLNRVICR